jgi:amino acid adenylation domain-containing protein
VITRENFQDLYPLSPLQEGMLYEAQRSAHATTHFEQITWHIRGSIDTDAFRRAWQALAERHAALRTVIVAEKASRPVQVVLRRSTPDIHVVDLAGLDADTALERFEEFRARDRSSPPDILGPRLWRVALFRIAADRHVAMFSFHHVMLDGWSFGLLLGDLAAIYTAMLGNKPLPEPDWPSFGTFIKHIERSDREAARRFWTRRLGAAPESSALPALRRRRTGYAIPVNVVRNVSPQQTQAIEALARRLAVTTSSILQALWGLLLARHNDERAAVFASVVSGRSGDLEGAERIVGMCINTIPSVVVLEPGDSFAALVRRVHREAAEAAPFQHVPLAEVQPTGDAIGTLFAFENFPIHPAQFGLDGGGFSVESAESIEEVPYPVTLVATPGASLSLLLKFDPRAHDQAEIERVADRLEMLLSSALQRPDSPVDALEMLPPGELQLIEGFGSTEAPYEEGATVDRLFARIVATQPDDVAVQDGPTEVSYAELDRRVEALAALLSADLGLQRGQRVAVALDRSLDMIVAFLAVMRAGGAYVPVDPAQPADRAAFMLSDCRPAAVIATAEDLSRLPLPGGVRVLSTADFPRTGGVQGTLPALHADDAAYVIYTSGSTGQPKGSIVAHRGLVNLFPQLGRITDMGPSKSFAMIHSPSFDASILEILTALLNGGRLVIGRRDVVADPQLFGAFLRETKPSAALITPAHLRLLDPEDVGVLETLIAGGEAADADVLAGYCKGRRVINAYGPSEASIAATCHVLTPAAMEEANVPIGKPFDNVDIVIVDRLGRLAPIGTPGEILIGGAALGHGYLERPELTAERFVAHPLVAGERIYRTGDCGRWREDGAVDYLGRLDDQVKIRGFRVEPGEIQVRLAAHPAVDEAFVMARRTGDGSTVLHAYVVGGASAAPDVLRAHLARTLPDYMIPAAIVRLDRLPLTSSGKVDRAQLPVPGAVPVAQPDDSALDIIESSLLKIWREVLGDPSLDVDAKFLDNGGHSLAAMRIVTRVRRDLQRQLSLGEFFQNETVRALAECLRRKSTDSLVPISHASGAEDEALSHAQRRIWVLQQIGENAAAYNVGGAFILQGELERAAMQRALGQLVQRHEGLRTVFPVVDGVPRLRTLPASVVEPVWRDLSTGPDPDAAAIEAAEALMREPFDLVQGPVVRFGIYRLGPQRHLLAFAVHHVAFDGWSAEVIGRDLAQLYVAARDGTTADLPDLRISLGDAARWLNDRATHATAARRYWLDRFSDLPTPLQLATDLPRPNISSQVGSEVPVRLSRETVDRLAALGGPGTTTFMALVALVKLMLYRYSGQTDITIGHPIAGRDHPDLEPLIGCFVNTLPLRDRLSPAWSFRHLMESVRRTAIAAFDHSAYPFDLMVEELGLARSLNRNPLFDVMVLFAPRTVQPASFGDLVIEPAELPSAVAKFDFLFDFREGDGFVEGRIGFARDLFHPETVARMADHLAVLAEAAARDPGMTLSHLPLLTAGERHQQLQEWNPPLDGAAAPATCLHVEFERHAAATPDAVALVFGADRLTYGELNRRSDRLARRLQALGVGPEVPVGLSLGRSIDLLVGMLAILKAGGAYVPLDPGYPDQRLALIIARAELGIIVAGPDEALRLAAADRQIVRPDVEPDEASMISPAPVVSGTSVDSLAYILFTSGSTGEPKGVAITHRNVARLFTMVQPNFGFAPDDTVCLFHSYAFDVSVFEIWAAWLHGGTLVLAPADVTRSPPEMLELLRREKVTVLCQTPSAFKPLVDADATAGSPPLALRYVVLAGEALEPPSIAPWFANRGDVTPRLINMYGPTETTIYMTYYEVTKADLGKAVSPLGKPVADTPVLILDRDRQLLPVGAVGEIHIGGPSLARGYVNRPDLTAERFIADPFDPSGRARLYRTGDLGRFLGDGSIEYHGRIDHQVKVRGFRVELSEIEGRLGAHPDVQSCAVVTRVQAGNVELVGHVTLRRRVDAAALQQYLRQFLPGYMVPSHILVHERMPLTINGKIDRRALPDPEDVLAGRDAVVPPETPTEIELAEIWAGVLKRNDVSRDGDFFELGGHSLNAMQVITRVNNRFGLALQVRALFEQPVLADLAVSIEEALLRTIAREELSDMLDESGKSGEAAE